MKTVVYCLLLGIAIFSVALALWLCFHGKWVSAISSALNAVTFFILSRLHRRLYP